MDRQHNLETIEGLKPHKQQKMANETNSYFVRLIAIIGNKLNIYGKMRLENKMFKSCNDIMKKKKVIFENNSTVLYLFILLLNSPKIIDIMQN